MPEARRVTSQEDFVFEDEKLEPVKKFRCMQLKSKLVQSFAELHYEEPTELQEWAIDLIGKRKDVYLQCFSGLGMGKRVTMAIGVLQNIDLAGETPKVQALIITCLKKEHVLKTSHLATQRRAKKIQETVLAVGKYMNVKCHLTTFDTELKDDIHVLCGTGAHVVVGTAGRIDSLLRRRMIDPFGVKILVLDEADEMVIAGEDVYEYEHLVRILAHIVEGAQVIIFASRCTRTITDFLFRSDLRFTRIALDVDFGRIRHFCAFVEEKKKKDILDDLLTRCRTGKLVIFVRHAEKAEGFCKVYAYEGPCCLHYDDSKSVRYEKMEKFLNESGRLLFATDNLPYGSVKSGQISLVINFDFPTRRNYAHRFYRAGLVHGGGDVINFTTMADMEALKHVCDFYRISVQKLPKNYAYPATPK